MELGAILEHIKLLPNQAQTALLSGLKLTDAKNAPAGAVLVAMQILTALGLMRLIDSVLGEEHTSIDYLKQAMAAGRKQVPSCGILIGLLVADLLAYPKRIARVYEVQKLAKAWHTANFSALIRIFTNRCVLICKSSGIFCADISPLVYGRTWIRQNDRD
jgi:hypothetical protein